MGGGRQKQERKEGTVDEERVVYNAMRVVLSHSAGFGWTLSEIGFSHPGDILLARSMYHVPQYEWERK